MRAIVRAIVEFENDPYASYLKNAITNTSIKFNMNLSKNAKRFVYNFQTGTVDEIEVRDVNGDKLGWLMKEYLGYASENYPELFPSDPKEIS